jgi:hypothetical protein
MKSLSDFYFPKQGLIIVLASIINIEVHFAKTFQSHVSMETFPADKTQILDFGESQPDILCLNKCFIWSQNPKNSHINFLFL